VLHLRPTVPTDRTEQVVDTPGWTAGTAHVTVPPLQPVGTHRGRRRERPAIHRGSRPSGERSSHRTRAAAKSAG
jgi:hypothetical protein